jgi:acyl-coenzyme A thioesterase PaaI-like protein
MKNQAIQERWPEIGTYCWGCGRNNAHGLHIKSYWENDEAVCTWQPKEYHLAFPGVLNGGIIATLIDCHSLNTAIAAAYRAAGREIGSQPLLGYVTASLHVNYLRPTPMDRSVVLRARVKTMSPTTIVVTCSLLADDKECATGEVICARLHY